jgi:hypothetical protein
MVALTPLVPGVHENQTLLVLEAIDRGLNRRPESAFIPRRRGIAEDHGVSCPPR